MVYVGGIGALVYVVWCVVAVLYVGGVGAVVYWCGVVAVVHARGVGALVYVSGVCRCCAGRCRHCDVLVRCSCCGVCERCRCPGVCERCRCCGVLGAMYVSGVGVVVQARQRFITRNPSRCVWGLPKQNPKCDNPLKP